MKKIILLFSVLIPLFIYGQEEEEKSHTLFEDILNNNPSDIPDSLFQKDKDGLAKYYDRLSLTSDFIHTTRMHRDPSKLSAFTSFQKNIGLSEFQKKPFVLHANLKTPIVIANKKGLLRRRTSIAKRKGLFAVHIIPDIEIRIFQNDENEEKAFQDESLPVRTPSYKPKVSFLISSEKLWTGTKIKNSPLNKSYFDLQFYHYSNGQDGVENFSPYADTTFFNTYNGNFSDDLVFGFFYNWEMKFDKGGDIQKDTGGQGIAPDLGDITSRRNQSSNKIQRNRIYQSIGLEANWIRRLNNQSLWDDHTYHRTRIRYKLGWIHSTAFSDFYVFDKKGPNHRKYLTEEKYRYEEFRVFMNLDVIPDIGYQRVRKVNFQNRFLTGEIRPAAFHHRVNLTVTGHYRIPGTNASGFIETGWWGSDPYNAYFQESKFIFRVGLGFGFFEDERKSRSKDFKEKANLIRNSNPAGS